MFFLLKYLNLKFSNKFRSVPVRPNIIDMSIYYSITISTPWFIQTDIIFTGGWQGRPRREGAKCFEKCLSWGGESKFYSEMSFMDVVAPFLLIEPQVHNIIVVDWEHLEHCDRMIFASNFWLWGKDKKMIEFYFWICWWRREGLGFYKTLIRMYPWDIMVIGPGNSSLTHTLEYL